MATLKLELHGRLWIGILLGLLGLAASVPIAWADSPPLENDAEVIVYRQRALFGMMGSYEVSVNGLPVGELRNGSALRLRLAPGVYRLKVNPGFMTVKTESLVEAVRGDVRFAEYDFPTGPLANIAYIGSSIELRDAARARSEIIEFHAEGPGGLAPVVVVAKPVASTLQATGFAAVDQVEALPLQDVRARRAYAGWLALPNPRAFVVGPMGYFSYASGEKPKDQSLPSNPALRALDVCAKVHPAGCRLYALNDMVLWSPNDPGNPTTSKNGRTANRADESAGKSKAPDGSIPPAKPAKPTDAAAKQAHSDRPDGTANTESRHPYPKTEFAEISDVNSVPGISATCRERYTAWLSWANPKAFVIGPKGNCGFTTGTKPPSADLPNDPIDRVLEVCMRLGKGNCKVFAVDDAVVWAKE